MAEIAEIDRVAGIACDAAGLSLDVVEVSLIGHERGVFSTVYRVASDDRSVVVKMPVPGPNGHAARTSGAYDRERTAYEHLLFDGLRVPKFYGVVELKRGPALVLEDLSDYEMVDQIEGLRATQAMSIVDPLYECHAGISLRTARAKGVREVSPQSFKPAALAKGVQLVPNRDVFARVLDERQQRIDAFGALSDPVLCHGDPRADNLVIGPDVRLFDWQQIAIQAGEADLAWLAATSLEPHVRRSCEGDLVSRYALRTNRSFDEVWDRYQKAMIVPALAVLLLAQRKTTGRLQRLVEVSVERIGSAIGDHYGA